LSNLRTENTGRLNAVEQREPVEPCGRRSGDRTLLTRLSVSREMSA
jgi:hypothetical protein